MDKKTERLVNVARMYYEQDRTQSEIADRYGISRPMVSKLLKEARDRGIVTIRINAPKGNPAARRHSWNWWDAALGFMTVWLYPEGQMTRLPMRLWQRRPSLICQSWEAPAWALMGPYHRGCCKAYGAEGEAGAHRNICLPAHRKRRRGA